MADGCQGVRWRSQVPAAAGVARLSFTADVGLKLRAGVADGDDNGDPCCAYGVHHVGAVPGGEVGGRSPAASCDDQVAAVGGDQDGRGDVGSCRGAGHRAAVLLDEKSWIRAVGLVEVAYPSRGR